MTELQHYGIKGMKWGIRRENPSASTDASGNTVYSRKGKITSVDLADKEKGVSGDASRAATLKKQASKRSTDSLSNKELQDLVTRMNLEQQYSRLSNPQGAKSAKQQITDILVQQGKQEFNKFVQQQAAAQIGNLLKKR